MAGLLATLKIATGAVGESRGLPDDARPLVLCGRPAPLARLQSHLLQGDGADEGAVRAFALHRRLAPSDLVRLDAAALVVYGGELAATLDAATRSELELLGALAAPRLLLLEALDLPSEAVAQAGLVSGLTPADLLPYKRGHLPLAQLLRCLARRSGDAAPGLARRLPALRPYVVDELTEQAARRAAAVAGAVFVPGADLPALSALQLSLVLRIAACHGRPVSSDRALELVSVLGAGVGLRAVARELLDLVPGVGWAAKAMVAYSGTRALGRAADAYFAHGAPAGVERLRGAATRLRGGGAGGAGGDLR